MYFTFTYALDYTAVRPSGYGTLALRSRVSGFKTRSDHSLNLFPVVSGSSSTALVNSQLFCLRPVGVAVVVAVLFCRSFR